MILIRKINVVIPNIAAGNQIIVTIRDGEDLLMKTLPCTFKANQQNAVVYALFETQNPCIISTKGVITLEYGARTFIIDLSKKSSNDDFCKNLMKCETDFFSLTRKSIGFFLLIFF